MNRDLDIRNACTAGELMQAVEPLEYKHKEVLRKFIQWSKDRADYLMALYEGKSFDPENYDHW